MVGVGVLVWRHSVVFKPHMQCHHEDYVFHKLGWIQTNAMRTNPKKYLDPSFNVRVGLS